MSVRVSTALGSPANSSSLLGGADSTGSMHSAQSFCSTVVGGPLPTESRQGRHKQRYGSNGERLVAGCIPVRYTGQDKGPEAVEVCMITSRGGKGLVFPKGGWEDDETLEAAAKRETVEEAGVRGTLEGLVLGVFPFQSAKQEQLHNAHQGRCLAHMFVLHVAEELVHWPESLDRQRRWLPLADASRQCRHQWMRDALHAWIRREGWDACLAPLLQDAQPAPPPVRPLLAFPVEGCNSVTSDLSDVSDSVDLSRTSSQCDRIGSPATTATGQQPAASNPQPAASHSAA